MVSFFIRKNIFINGHSFFNRFLLPFLTVSLIFNFAANGQATDYYEKRNQEEHLENIREKYSTILNVDKDSLEHMLLYQMIEKWPEFVDANPNMLESHHEGIFAQYIYYLTFNTKIPAIVMESYKDEKTYLFKNPIYLRCGDLLFFGKNESVPNRVAVFLQNNIVAYPSRDGQLNFVSVNDIKKSNAITAAKIEKNE